MLKPNDKEREMNENIPERQARERRCEMKICASDR